MAKKSIDELVASAASGSSPKRGRGRPKGSRNKKSTISELAASATKRISRASEESVPAKRRGRPPGAKAKILSLTDRPVTTREALRSLQALQDASMILSEARKIIAKTSCDDGISRTSTRTVRTRKVEK